MIKKLQNESVAKDYDLAGQVALMVCDEQDQNNGLAITKHLLFDYERVDLKISTNLAEKIFQRISKKQMFRLKLGPVLKNLTNGKISFKGKTLEQIEKEIMELQQKLVASQANGLPTHGMQNS